MTPLPTTPEEARAEADRRLDEIERALKFDPGREYRRELVREYLEICERTENAKA